MHSWLIVFSILPVIMDEKQVKHLSKFISLVLRHRPDIIGLSLDENGWANTNELLEKMNNDKKEIDLPLLEFIVSTNAKQRFSFNTDGSMIRANQGHSVDIDLQLQPARPPVHLFHGTAIQFVPSILETGIQKGSRQHVHLSSDLDTAKQVGSRHGKPAIFQINSGQMVEDGFVFYLSENKVWLTDNVPAQYLSLLE
jgi:putative RNA 2'-phosphotransferase